ncbi:hypothetical protein MPTK1_3g04130 [Marchantia polymorpha subsp. ruderalis]|uniref:Uncharacterized protein n=2 Tax=Marchantia polymorpha TaxID=3197 RepID=A0AAF6AXA2_MARPO|nr:hypothetical protein MARPO_0022s0118 [Marchantia polymorpha]BBN04386.1 hypothetical protein Mp_3g04130 [Marchantia polymorpha subsp. ruderalis]|eukprot:PTQ44018.1 hypothetical protein MARPO_0022s0118 [Marchantia polymorpha]
MPRRKLNPRPNRKYLPRYFQCFTSFIHQNDMDGWMISTSVRQKLRTFRCQHIYCRQICKSSRSTAAKACQATSSTAPSTSSSFSSSFRTTLSNAVTENVPVTNPASHVALLLPRSPPAEASGSSRFENV